jgi:hypothetical protein
MGFILTILGMQQQLSYHNEVEREFHACRRSRAISIAGAVVTALLCGFVLVVVIRRYGTQTHFENLLIAFSGVVTIQFLASVSSWCGQRIILSDKGLVSHSPLKTQRMAWDDIVKCTPSALQPTAINLADKKRQSIFLEFGMFDNSEMLREEVMMRLREQQLA